MASKSTSKVKVDETRLKEALEKSEKCKEAHRRVTNTIHELLDTVEDNVLLDRLHLLDIGTWDEVIEERYLAQSCGLPTCVSKIVASNYMGARYKIKRNERKIYTAIPKSEKFCSTLCYHKSSLIQQQLYDEPLWFCTDRKPKSYSFNFDTIQSQPKNADEILIDEVDRLLVTRLNDMKVAENVESSSSDDDDADEERKRSKELEDKNFMDEIRSFVTSVSKDSKAKKTNAAAGGSTGPVFGLMPNSSNQQIAKAKENITPKEPQKLLAEAAEEPQQRIIITADEEKQKLERLRAKYSKQKIVKKPEIIEPPPMDPTKAAKLSEGMR